MVSPLSDDHLSEIIQVYQQNNCNIAATARHFERSRSTIHHALCRAAERGLDGSTPKPLPPGQKIKGISTLYNVDGTVTAQWVKTVTEADIESTLDEIREALAEFKGASPLPAAPDMAAIEPDIVTVYPVADWHIGLLSWHEETGHNFDVRIARRTIETAMTRLVSVSPNSTQAVLLGLGDLLHSDGYDPLTARSKNVLDVDGRYPRVLKAATQLLLFTIDLMLQKHQSVLVRILPGNHDDQSAIAVALALGMYYANNDRVEVDEDPGRFWWWLWGNTLLGGTHGDKAKMKDLPLVMAARNPDAWARSKFRHVYTGHVHTEKGIELSGVTVESFQTPAAPDAWSVAGGYDSGRSVVAITHHKKHGEIMRQKVNIVK